MHTQIYFGETQAVSWCNVNTTCCVVVGREERGREREGQIFGVYVIPAVSRGDREIGIEREMRIVVLSGGSATNALVSCFEKVANLSRGGGGVSRDTQLSNNNTTYIIPVSDDGGSTSEILRCFGGLAVGDLRNRALVLFQDEGAREFLHHRLNKDSRAARAEWDAVVGGTHPLWRLLDRSRQECRALIAESLRVFQAAQAQASAQTQFNFSTASLGNIVLKALEMQYGIDDALHKFLRLGGVHEDVVSIMPCVTLQGAGGPGPGPAGPGPAAPAAPRLDLQLVLLNGDVITGQSEISHPAGGSQLHFSKTADSHPRLAAAVQQLRYVVNDGKSSSSSAFADASSAHASAVHVSAHGPAIASIRAADLIVYSIGSLITSLMPSLIVPEIAAAIAANTTAQKVLLQNGTYDRESYGLSCEDYTSLVASTLQQSMAEGKFGFESQSESQSIPISQFITHVIRLEDSEIVSRPSPSPTSSNPEIVTLTIPSNGNRLYHPDHLYQTLRSIIQ